MSKKIIAILIIFNFVFYLEQKVFFYSPIR